MQKFTKLLTICSLLSCLLNVSTNAAEEARLKPYILGTEAESTDITETLTTVKAALETQGFEVVGSYEPYASATIIVVTNDELKAIAAKTPFGGYGAMVRVAVTDMNGQLQVSYTNPPYYAAAYRLQDDLMSVKTNLETALGNQMNFGSEKGLTAKKLSKYHYMFGMERFDSLKKNRLATFKTQAEAIDAVEAGLAAGRGGVTKVYRIDLPGGTNSVFGVALSQGEGADAYVMERIDFKDVRSTTHLPYEILVSDGTVYHLFARFRIAIDFPDLSMMGGNSFMSIMSAPGAIKDALSAVVTTSE